MGESKRRSKVVTIDEAIGQITPGSSILLGGLMLSNRPSGLIREIIKKKITDLTVISTPQAGYDVDLLVGAGLVKTAYVGYVGFEYLGMAHLFRKAAEEGSCEVIPCDESTLAGALMANIEGMPYHPVQSILGSDILKVNPMVKRYMPPFGDRELIAVPAVYPDFSLIHAQQADEFGNIRYLGSEFADLIVAKAGKKVIVTVEEIVSHESFIREPLKTSIPGHYVDMVVEYPGGSHPCESHGYYVVDEEHLLDYIQCGRKSLKENDDSAIEAYLEKFVYSINSPFDYIEKIGGFRKMFELKKQAVIG